ncbi:hypothetical protein G6F65_018212 [Rhizopus arrhizus]|nr:hypothetical protein G6F65_018212 [Rhizopus arrhizus]
MRLGSWRIGQQPGAHAHLPVEERGNQRDAQRGHGGDDHQHRQPAGVDGTAANRAADAAFGEARRGHAGVMHADDGQAHHQRSERAQEEGVALLGTQAEGDPQRGAGGTDGHRDRRGEPARVVIDAGLHAHRRHAQVVHGGDAQPHQHRAGQQPSPRQAGPRHQPQRIGTGQQRARARPVARRTRWTGNTAPGSSTRPAAPARWSCPH